MPGTDTHTEAALRDVRRVLSAAGLRQGAEVDVWPGADEVLLKVTTAPEDSRERPRSRPALSTRSARADLFSPPRPPARLLRT
ncbi:hypothetical protein RCO28_34685 [Streptomyces sp. LHD-70]|uniref:hypothetical protein n=1 Tax=Streptomyces sp. LHD-70 TaxID=3072140 RepID=UPI00280D704D|nr:hypothetical protein [Streptomyces sp. LHD-70]MDQ8707581.1 hypothetical protein [Streptomyces sp. LHD-70]